MEKLLKYETFSKNVWECCCGQGHLSKVLEDYGYDVKSTDLIDRGYGIGDIDFLKTNEKFDGDIITNPPYKLAKEFVVKALDTITDGHKVCFLLRIQFLEGVNRYTNLFSKYPPKYIYIPTKRINCARNGEFDKYTGSVVCFIWIIWEKGYKGEPTVRWIM